MLEVFKNATTLLSGVYYPISCLVVNQLYLIASKLEEVESKSDLFKEMVRQMKLKVKQYLKNCLALYLCRRFEPGSKLN